MDSKLIIIKTTIDIKSDIKYSVSLTMKNKRG